MKYEKAVPLSGEMEDTRIQEYLDMIAPSVMKFETDYFICGNTFRCVWALREYPTATDEQAILFKLRDGPVAHKKAVLAAAALGSTHTFEAC